MTEKLYLKYCEFYITNVCNLSCSGCNRFNNYKFTGWQRWSDYKDIYKQWSHELDIGHMSIMGGEPTLNPTFMEWVYGISELWPRRYLRIITNGFRLDKMPALYEFLNTKVKKSGPPALWVGIHNKQHKTQIINKVKSFLVGPCSTKFNSDDPHNQYMDITDSNGVSVRVEYNWWFHQGAIVTNQEQLSLQNSDPVKAHEICHMKYCHHFDKGKLYKCAVAAVLPEFDQQHTLTLSNEDRHLIYEYRPMTINNSPEEKQQFVNDIKKPIDMCKFCPEVYQGEQIFAEEKRNIKL